MVMLCGWEGNCRSGVALAMHAQLKFSGQSTGSKANVREWAGHENSAYILLRPWPPFLTFTLPLKIRLQHKEQCTGFHLTNARTVGL